MKKHEWRKKEKGLYLPKNQPQFIDVPEFQFLTLKGEGDPNQPEFTECIKALYSVAYAIKMTLKKEHTGIKHYTDYTVYPLEGIWSINEEAQKNFDGTINKADFVYKIMLRQPSFVTKDFFEAMLVRTKKRKPNPKLNDLQLEKITDGSSVQMMHIGAFDTEPASFEIMENFATQQGLKRLSKVHREIYISDFRKVAPEKLKTVLRFKVSK